MSPDSEVVNFFGSKLDIDLILLIVCINTCWVADLLG